MANVKLLFRIDIGFDPDRGYAATMVDAVDGKMKGIKGNSIEQITSRLRNVIHEEHRRKKMFPIESEPVSPIITPESGDPLFHGQ